MIQPLRSVDQRLILDEGFVILIVLFLETSVNVRRISLMSCTGLFMVHTLSKSYLACI